MPPLGASGPGFFYDRTATVNRASSSYPTSGMAAEAYAAIYTGVACSIQLTAQGRPILATDTTPAPRWQVLLDPVFVGSVLQNDQLTDDLGRRFRVLAAYPTPLGWQLDTHDWDAHSSP